MKLGSPRPEALEDLLRRLRGGSLLLAVLSYDLGLRVSQLVKVRIRDVNTSRGTIIAGGRERSIPALIVDDLRDYIHERLCGSDASYSAGKCDQPLFSADIVECTREACVRWLGLCGQSDTGRWAHGFSSELIASETMPEIAADALLRVSGRCHKRSALRHGLKVSSPLDLFDKGPRIVRRKSAGCVDAYYVWRTTAAY
jgi:integrase